MRALSSCLLLLMGACSTVWAAAWKPEHTVVVILENKSLQQVLGASDMPYLNSLIADGAVMTNAYFSQTPYTGDAPAGLPARPSQANYLYLFSGNNQGILPEWSHGIANGLIPATLRPFTTPNLGAAIIEHGGTFAGFSESLPYPHYDQADDPEPRHDFYRRKHNPAINWINLSGADIDAGKARFILPVGSNLAFGATVDPVDAQKYRGFAAAADGSPLEYSSLPTLSLVVPNEQNDAHSSSNAACDAWLQAHIKPYADWARAHNSLLVITYDEDGTTNASHGPAYSNGIDRIPTLFYGPPAHVRVGRYEEKIDHLNVLSTLLDRYEALEPFRKDFRDAYVSAESVVELRNLRPIKDVFGEGPPLPAPGEK